MIANSTRHRALRAASSLILTALLAPATADAELTSDEDTYRAIAGARVIEPPPARPNIVSFPPVSPVRVLWLAIGQRGSFAWPAVVAPLALALQPPVGRSEASSSFCLSPRCSFPRLESLDVDPLSAAPNASRLVIESMGPMGAAALSLFSTPPLRKSQSLVLRIAPLFAMGGTGLELRGAWW